METILVGALILGAAFWKKSPLYGVLHPVKTIATGGGTGDNLGGGINNTMPGTQPGGATIKATGTGSDPAKAPTATPDNPLQQAQGWLALGGGLAKSLQGLIGGSSSPSYGSNPGQVYPDGTIGAGQLGAGVDGQPSSDPFFQGSDPNGNYDPNLGGTGTLDNGYSYDGTLSGGDDGSSQWDAAGNPNIIDPYSGSDYNVGGGDSGTPTYDGTLDY